MFVFGLVLFFKEDGLRGVGCCNFLWLVILVGGGGDLKCKFDSVKGDLGKEVGDRVLYFIKFFLDIWCWRSLVLVLIKFLGIILDGKCGMGGDVK